MRGISIKVCLKVVIRHPSQSGHNTQERMDMTCLGMASFPIIWQYVRTISDLLLSAEYEHGCSDNPMRQSSPYNAQTHIKLQVKLSSDRMRPRLGQRNKQEPVNLVSYSPERVIKVRSMYGVLHGPYSNTKLVMIVLIWDRTGLLRDISVGSTSTEYTLEYGIPTTRSTWVRCDD